MALTAARTVLYRRVTMATNPTTAGDLLELVRARVLATSGRGREVRLAARLSLADVAGVVGTAASTVQRWELGARCPYGAAAVRWLHLIETLEEAQRCAG